jgi:hypothetical protein
MRTNTQEAIVSAYIVSIGKRTRATLVKTANCSPAGLAEVAGDLSHCSVPRFE